MLHRYVICQIRMWHDSVTCQIEMAHGLVGCQINIYQGCIVTDCLFKSLPGLTANKPPKLCTGPSIAESVSMPLLTHCAENPLAVCGLLAHQAQYCRKCIHAFTDPLCWESTGSLWFTRTQGPILQKVYPCLYWPTVLRIHWQSVVHSHTRPNIAESKYCISNSIVTKVSADRTAQSSMHKMPGCQNASSDVVASPQSLLKTTVRTVCCCIFKMFADLLQRPMWYESLSLWCLILRRRSVQLSDAARARDVIYCGATEYAT